MSKDNEFLRGRPTKKNGFAFSILHKGIPIAICLLFIWFSSQYAASLLNYDPLLCGDPWYVTETGKPVYPFYLLALLIIKHAATSNKEIGDIISFCANIMVGGIFGAVVVYFILSYTRTFFNKEEAIYGTARWGTSKDLKANGLLEDSGVVIGQLKTANVVYKIDNGAVKLKVKKCAQLIQHSGKTSTILFAPSRSGKGINSVVPTCLNFGGSMIIIDPKGENYNITAGHRSEFSHIYRLSPVSKDTLRFNILDEIEEGNAYRDASMLAEILATPADGKVDGNSKHWIDTAKDLLTGTILHILTSDCSDKSLYGVLSFLSQASKGGADDDKGGALLNSMISANHCTTEIHEIVCNVARRNLARPDTERGSIFSTAVTALQIFEDPMVRYASSASDFCLNDFRLSESPITLYLTIPFSDLDRLASFIRLIITFILRKFSQGETQFGEQKLKNPILFLIDEFPTLGAFPVLETMMGILSGYGITFFLICQSFTQVVKLYGENNPIMDHCRVMATFAMSDVKSAEQISKMIGIESVTNSNVSNSGSRFDYGMNNLNVSEQTLQRNLMNSDEIQHLPANQGIVFSQGMPATIFKKTAFFDDPRFKHNAGKPYPKNREELLLECVGSHRVDPNGPHWYDLPEWTFLPSSDNEIIEEMKVELPSDEMLKEISAERRGAMI